MVKYVLSYDTVIDGREVGKGEYGEYGKGFRYITKNGIVTKINLPELGAKIRQIVVDNGFGELVEKILNEWKETGKYSILKWGGKDPYGEAGKIAENEIDTYLYGGETGVRKGHGYIGNSSPFPHFGRGQPVEGHEGCMERVDYGDKNIELVKYFD